MRPTQPRDIRAIKTATSALIEECGGVEAAATITRVGKSQLSDYANPHKPDVVIPADVAADLEATTHAPLITAVLARLTHHQIMPLPEAVRGDELRACAEALRVAAEAGVTLFDAAADGLLDDAEHGVLDANLGALVAATLRARALLAGRPLPLGQGA